VEARRGAGSLYNEVSKKYLESGVPHERYVKGMSKEQLEKIKNYYEERCGKHSAGG